MTIKSITLLCLSLGLALGLGCESKGTTSTKTDTPNATPPVPSKTVKAAKKFKLAKLTHSTKPGGTVTFDVLPTSGFKINPEYPWKFKLLDGGGATLSGLAKGETLAKSELKLSATKAEIPLTVEASTKPGTYSVTGAINLSICERGNEARCLWFTDEAVALKLDVTQ